MLSLHDAAAAAVAADDTLFPSATVEGVDARVVLREASTDKELSSSSSESYSGSFELLDPFPANVEVDASVTGKSS